MASIEEHAKTVEVLLRGGAQVNVQDDDGDFPLLLASATGCTKTVKLLLDHGAEVNMQNSDGNSALSSAITASHYFPGSEEYTELLLHHGATVSAQVINTIGHHDSSQEATADTTGIFTHLRNSAEVDKEAEENYLDSKFQKLEENLTLKYQEVMNSFAANYYTQHYKFLW